VDTARQAWLAAHPYLAPIARFQALVEDAAAGAPRRPEPAWIAAWTDDHAAGVPLLHSAATAALPAAGTAALAAVLERAAAAEVPGHLGEGCRALRRALPDADALRAALEWLVLGDREDGAPAPPHPGLLRLLGWTALRPLLAATIEEAAPLRTEERWGHEHCPTCGAVPALAVLAGDGASRTRALACGPCGTRWAYRRLGCPFCDNADPARLGVLEVEGTALRLDVCGACGGYLKTCVGDADAELLLADWPTLHLDVIARDRGLRRAGASLYQI
jgi:FdhE protein